MSACNSLSAEADDNINIKYNCETISCAYLVLVSLLDFGCWYLRIEYLKTQDLKCTPILDLFYKIWNYMLNYKIEYRAKTKIKFYSYPQSMYFFRTHFKMVQLILLLIICYNRNAIKIPDD